MQESKKFSCHQAKGGVAAFTFANSDGFLKNQGSEAYFSSRVRPKVFEIRILMTQVFFGERACVVVQYTLDESKIRLFLFTSTLSQRGKKFWLIFGTDSN